MCMFLWPRIYRMFWWIWLLKCISPPLSIHSSCIGYLFISLHHTTLFTFLHIGCIPVSVSLSDSPIQTLLFRDIVILTLYSLLPASYFWLVIVNIYEITEIGLPVWVFEDNTSCITFSPYIICLFLSPYSFLFVLFFFHPELSLERLIELPALNGEPQIQAPDK